MNDFKILSAKYKTSVVESANLLDDLPEIAFVGRSNVGKSSFINSITNQKKLAKTSSTPGLTKMVNYFEINNSFYFVDLPGYGFSKTGKKHKSLWASLVSDYLEQSSNIKLVFLLVDIRHEPTQLDIEMQKYLFYMNIPYKIIATKCDKIPRSKLVNYLQKIAKILCVGKDNILPFSTEEPRFKKEIFNIISDYVSEERVNE